MIRLRERAVNQFAGARFRVQGQTYWEETSMYTDPPARGYIILSIIGILLILIVPAIGFSIYGS